MNATNHEFLPEEVMAFLDGELSAEKSAAFAAHLNKCADCSAVAANLHGLSKDLATWHVPQPSTSLEQAAGVRGLQSIQVRRSFSAPSWAIAAGSAVLAVLLLLVVGAPNLLRSRIAANESIAVGALRTLNTAAVTYLDAYGHYPPSLRNFGPPTSGKPTEEAADLVDAALASGQKSGYLFKYHSFPPLGSTGVGTYNIQADPMDPRYGVRHFSTDQTGVLYANGVALGSDIFAKRTQANSVATKVPQPSELPIEAAPMIARSAVLRLEVKRMSDARERLNEILAQHRGYIAQLSATNEGNAQPTLVASLRVPANDLIYCIAEMKKLGRVTEETLTGEEVTSQHRDLVAHLSNARTTESKLNDVIQQRAGKVTDILEVEKESARVRGEIEQMEAEQKTLEHSVDFATIDLKLAEEYKAQLNTPAPSVFMQLRNAGVNGFRNAFESLLALVLFLAESGPSLLLWVALLGIPTWRLWKRYRRAQTLEPLAGA